MRPCWALICACACGRIGFGAGVGSDGPLLGDGSRPDIVFTANVAFVTPRTVVPGSLGGLAGADALCQSAATQASLPGTYVAWLSSTTTNAIDRLAGSRGWVRSDGLPFADTAADIAAGRIFTPISLQADGSEQVFQQIPDVATATAADGTVAPPGSGVGTCGDWTSSNGSSTGGDLNTTAGWTTGGLLNTCSMPTRIYCFGIGNNVPVTPSDSGRRAFISNPIQPGNGIGALDTQCQSDATAAGLVGTFLAFVATTTAPANSRFDGTGPLWVRVDGVRLAPTAADVMSLGQRIPLDLHADQTLAAGVLIIETWTGATAPTALGVNTCMDWTVGTSGRSGSYGNALLGGTHGFWNTEIRCNVAKSVYCLEL
jgi:hypothetical protein